jgi:hypothetical protein
VSYETWLPGQVPAWMKDPDGAHLWAMVGRMLDLDRDKLNQGVLARFPVKGSVDANGTFSTPPTEALDAIGADRGLPRASGESDAAYAARLINAWATWTFAGSHYGVLRALEVAGFVSPKGIIVQDNGRWSQITGSAGTEADLSFGDLAACANRGGLPGWTFDFEVDIFSRFALVYTSMPAALSTEAGQTIHNQIVNKWRPGKADFVGTFVIDSARIWGFAAAPPALPVWGVGNWGGASDFIDPSR